MPETAQPDSRTRAAFARQQRGLGRFFTGLLALVAAVVPLLAFAAAPANALSPTTCHKNAGGPPTANYRYCTFDHVGLPGAMVTSGAVTWHYIEDKVGSATGYFSFVLKDNLADGDCAELRLAWTPALGKAAQAHWPIDHACGNGTAKGEDGSFGTGNLSVVYNFGYYMFQVGFSDNGNEFGWTKIWQQQIDGHCGC